MKNLANYRYFSVALLMLSGVTLAPVVAEAARAEVQCPQERSTEQAPDQFLKLENPLEPTGKNYSAGRAIYQGSAYNGINCAACHGRKGEGDGMLSGGKQPAPRNFTCPETIQDVPDGQLFWVIRNGSPGTAMPGHGKLKDKEVWQLVLEIRRLSDS